MTGRRTKDPRHCWPALAPLRRSGVFSCHNSDDFIRAWDWLSQIELRLQLLPLRCSRRSRRKGYARAPPRMTIQDVPFKRAVRASMPPHVEKHFTAPARLSLMNLFQLRPDFPNVPPFPELRLSLFQSRHTVRERHGTGGGHRPEPAQIVGTATGRVNAANRSSAAVHGVVRSVLFQSRSRDQSDAG